jgi:hypothetical protein
VQETRRERSLKEEGRRHEVRGALKSWDCLCVCVVEISRQIPCCGARPEPENNQIVIIGKSGGGGGGGN